MHPIRSFRLYIKKNFYAVYPILRKIILPVASIFLGKTGQLVKRTVKRVSHGGKNFLIVLEPKNGFVDSIIYSNGVYEPDILNIISENLQEGDIFVDVGANIGQHSLFAASIVGEQGKVFSFEPIPDIAKQFRESITINNFDNIINLAQFACGDEDKTVDIYLREGNIGGSSITPFALKSVSQTISIQVKKCEDLLSECHERIKLVKIDTEGYEPEVISGFIARLEKDLPTIIIEYSPIFWADKSSKRGYEMLRKLEDIGYSFFDIEKGENKIHDITSWATSFNSAQTNLICRARKTT